MNLQHRDQELDDVLDAYVAESIVPSQEHLAAWTRRYPHYQRELAEFTATWSMMSWLPPAAEPAGEAALVQRGMGAIAGLLQRHSAPHARPTAIASLLEEGRARGLAVAALAEHSELSIPLLLKLDRRLIRFATLPRQIVERVAGAIGRDAASVAAYLQGAPRLATGASYHAPAAPALGAQEEFAAAVRADLTLPEERRAELLALASSAGNEA